MADETTKYMPSCRANNKGPSIQCFIHSPLNEEIKKDSIDPPPPALPPLPLHSPKVGL